MGTGRFRYSRTAAGRFRRATLENTFGLTVDVCPHCRRINPRDAGTAPAGNCHACGGVLRPVSQCQGCEQEITLISDHWRAGDGDTACAHAAVPHKPKEGDAPATAPEWTAGQEVTITEYDPATSAPKAGGEQWPAVIIEAAPGCLLARRTDAGDTSGLPYRFQVSGWLVGPTGSLVGLLRLEARADEGTTGCAGAPGQAGKP